MKILIVDKPLQTKTTPDPQYVENQGLDNEYIPEWCVDTERANPQFDLNGGNREFMEWLKRKERDIIRLNEILERETFDYRIEGIYLYDICAHYQKICLGVEETADAITFYPRFDYIKVKQ